MKTSDLPFDSSGTSPLVMGQEGLELWVEHTPTTPEIPYALCDELTREPIAPDADPLEARDAWLAAAYPYGHDVLEQHGPLVFVRAHDDD